MPRTPFLFLPFLFAAACAPAPGGGNTSVDINAAAVQAQGAVAAYGANAGGDAPVDIAETDAVPNGDSMDSNAVAPLDPPAPGTPGGLPDDRTPLSEARFTPDSAQGAANVVQTYYALIGEGKYAGAFALQQPGATGAKTAAAFAAEFARYSEFHANVGGPGAIDAGAGQRYVTVPVQIYARLTQGKAPLYQIGTVTLHRTDVDGASAAQRMWRIQTITSKAAPKR